MLIANNIATKRFLGRLKMCTDWKMREYINRHQTARLENARHASGQPKVT